MTPKEALAPLREALEFYGGIHVYDPGKGDKLSAATHGALLADKGDRARAALALLARFEEEGEVWFRDDTGGFSTSRQVTYVRGDGKGLGTTVTYERTCLVLPVEAK